MKIYNIYMYIYIYICINYIKNKTKFTRNGKSLSVSYETNLSGTFIYILYPDND